MIGCVYVVGEINAYFSDSVHLKACMLCDKCACVCACLATVCFLNKNV